MRGAAVLLLAPQQRSRGKRARHDSHQQQRQMMPAEQLMEQLVKKALSGSERMGASRAGYGNKSDCE